MFSGKTTARMNQVRAWQQNGDLVAMFKPGIAYRNRNIESHSGLTMPARSLDTVDELTVAVGAVQAIAIDESQFLEPDLVARLLSLRLEANWFLAGLDRDFR